MTTAGATAVPGTVELELGRSPLGHGAVQCLQVALKCAAFSRQCLLVSDSNYCTELELELIQTQMTQKPMLRAEVYARALRASQNLYCCART
jgi:hypothetical protein